MHLVLFNYSIIQLFIILGINPTRAPQWKSTQGYKLLNSAEERDRYITLHQARQIIINSKNALLLEFSNYPCIISRGFKCRDINTKI